MKDALPVSICLAVSASSAEALNDNPAVTTNGSSSLCMGVNWLVAVTLILRDSLRNNKKQGLHASRSRVETIWHLPDSAGRGIPMA